MKMLTRLRIFMLSMSLFMVYLAIKTSLQSDLWAVWPRLGQEPWFTTTLVDFYFNITIISLWVIYKENSAIRALVWISAFVFLGSIATAFYVFLQLLKLKKDDSISKVFLRDV